MGQQMTENEIIASFAKIWASNGQVYGWNDAQIAQGWATIGDAKPTRVQFNALQQTTDIKLQWLYENRVPAGTVQYFAGPNAPAGYLICDGKTVSREAYAKLFAVIGTLYGAGDGATTFNLPDLRGEFIRGLDGGRGVDTGRLLGSLQSSQNQAHTHNAVTQASSHSHTGATSESSHSHSVNGYTGGGGEHSHSFGLIRDRGQSGRDETLYGDENESGIDTYYTNTTGHHNHSINLTSSNNTHSHSFGTDTNTHSHAVTIEPNGGLEARPRNIALTVIIKF